MTTTDAAPVVPAPPPAMPAPPPAVPTVRTSALPTIGDWADRAELTRLQEGRVEQVLAWAARSPFYRDLLQRRRPQPTLEALRDLPVTTKQDLHRAYPFGMLAVEPSRLATYHESSGTAGTPTPSYYTQEDWQDLAERYARKWVGMGPEDMFLVRTPYALMVTGHLAHAAARLHGATVVPGDNRSLAMPYARVVRVLHDLRVTLTWSMPTETLMWAVTAEEAGLQPGRDFPALRALFVGGEPLTDARRARIARIWGVPVVEEFGSTETGSLAGQCPNGRLHLWSDRAVFEVYDPATGTTADEGDGQLVVTPLYREAMPLLRYNLGDDVRVRWHDCPCGWPLPTIQVLGRSGFGYPVGRTTVNQHAIEELVFSLPDEHRVYFWRGLAAPDGLQLQLEVRGEDPAGAAATLEAAVRERSDVPCTVTPLPVGSLVPREMLTASRDVVKPRSLFGPGEDWDRAHLYY